MKRMLVLCICMVLLLLPLFTLSEKEDSFPDRLQVTYTVDERKINNDQSFVSKEYITTCQPMVDREINGLVDTFDTEFSSDLQRTVDPKRNSRLDIHIVSTRSGKRCLSFLVLARESFNRQQVRSPFVCRAFDMVTGKQITLVDVLGRDSEAWDVLAETIYYELDSYFPMQEAAPDKLIFFCRKETIMETPFLLGPVCLTLVYEAKALYPLETSLMFVTVPYNALRGMMSIYGECQTDNSRYKMVALTFEDGPDYDNTAKVLNCLRRNGAQATFFVLGTQLEENPDITLRAHDELHSLQSHHYRHVRKSTDARIQEDTWRMEKLMATTWGLKPWLFRAPYDRFRHFIEAGVDLPMIAFDVDARDWLGRPPGEVLNLVKKQVHDGAIIRMHDTLNEAAEYCQLITEWLFENGYMCVTTEELFIHYQQEMVSGEVSFNVTPTN